MERGPGSPYSMLYTVAKDTANGSKGRGTIRKKGDYERYGV
jgi:hypothetical protein